MLGPLEARDVAVGGSFHLAVGRFIRALPFPLKLVAARNDVQVAPHGIEIHTIPKCPGGHVIGRKLGFYRGRFGRSACRQCQRTGEQQCTKCEFNYC